MLTTQNSLNASQPALRYISARLTEGKEWFVSYYATYPPTGKLRRKKIKLNRIESITQRRAAARRLIIEINNKLSQDWNPFVEAVAPKAFHRLDALINTYLSVQSKELEECSIRTYRSFLGLLVKNLNECKFSEQMFIYQFDRNIASEIMIKIKQNPNVAPRSYNNYLIFFKTFFNWAKSFNYVAENPFEHIQRISKKHIQTHRELFSPKMRTELKDYLIKENPRYLAMCMLCYYCFVRPHEISWLKVGDIDFKHQIIRVSAEHAKNDHSSFRTIPNAMMPYLIDLDRSGASSDFLFSADHRGQFVPGKKHLSPLAIAKYWNKIRKHFKWGIEIKFYNLKHTGITNMLSNGVAPNFVQGQADHHSLEMTSIYAATSTPQGHDQIKEKADDF